MELIIAAVLFIALVACWVFLPGKLESSHAHSSSAAEPHTAYTVKA